jgi:hypothetical protein
MSLDAMLGGSEHVTLDMSRVERDPERGRAAAARLKALGVKGVLIKAAEQGYITQLACQMPECFCPEELGGACYFEPVTAELELTRFRGHSIAWAFGPGR